MKLTTKTEFGDKISKYEELTKEEALKVLQKRRPGKKTYYLHISVGNWSSGHAMIKITHKAALDYVKQVADSTTRFKNGTDRVYIQLDIREDDNPDYGRTSVFIAARTQFTKFEEEE